MSIFSIPLLLALEPEEDYEVTSYEVNDGEFISLSLEYKMQHIMDTKLKKGKCESKYLHNHLMFKSYRSPWQVSDHFQALVSFAK